MLRSLGLPSKFDLRIEWAENRVLGEKGDQNSKVHIKIFPQDVKVSLQPAWHLKAVHSDYLWLRDRVLYNYQSFLNLFKNISFIVASRTRVGLEESNLFRHVFTQRNIDGWGSLRK